MHYVHHVMPHCTLLTWFRPYAYYVAKQAGHAFGLGCLLVAQCSVTLAGWYVTSYRNVQQH